MVGKNGKLNEKIEVSALWSNCVDHVIEAVTEGMKAGPTL